MPRAVDDEREREHRRRRRHRHARRGLGVLHLEPRRARSIPDHPHGLFFRDTRFLSELRLRAQRHVARAARGHHAPIRSAACSCCAAIPAPGRADSHLVLVPPPLRRPRHARRHRDRELRRGGRVLLGRVAARRRLRRPVRGEGGPGPEARASSPSRRAGARITFTYQRGAFTPGDARRLQRAAAHRRRRTSPTR